MIKDSSSGYITGCRSTGNDSNGIFVRNASSASVYSSTFSSNAGSGASVRDNSYGYFEGCTFADNTRNGIFVGYSSSAGIAKNDITGNAQPGVNVSGGSVIESNGANLIHGNGIGDGPPGSHAGVYVYNGSFSIRYDSDLGDPDEIYDNTEGFRVEGFGVINLTDYYIHGNSSDGILMSNYTMITFGPDATNQTITDNGRYGLSYFSTTQHGGPPWPATFANVDFDSTPNTSGATNCWDCGDSQDRDGDGYGYNTGGPFGGDCNDADSSINLGATEVCDDGIDNDCDGLIDEDCP